MEWTESACQICWDSPGSTSTFASASTSTSTYIHTHTHTYLFYVYVPISPRVWDPMVTAAPVASSWSEGQFCLSLQELHSNPHFYSANARRLDLCQGLVGKFAQPQDTHLAAVSLAQPKKTGVGKRGTKRFQWGKWPPEF